MRIQTLAALAALSLPLVLSSACASSETSDDELADESNADDALDGKADATAGGVYTYFEISTDLRKCAAPTCGGFFLKRLNRSTTTCVDGSTAAQCYAPELDWSEAALSEAQQAKLLAAAQKDATSSGTFGIVRGRFAKTNSTPVSSLGRFVITEAWVAEGTTVSHGVFAKVALNGVRCIAAPCPSLTEKGLNNGNQADISDLKWSTAHLSDHQLEGFNAELTSPSGILIAGDRYSFSVAGRPGKGRTVTAAYHRLVDACAPQGCSGEICADHGVVSSCIYRPEYACYATATCERQPEGSCGWTPTPELETCLGN